VTFNEKKLLAALVLGISVSLLAEHAPHSTNPNSNRKTNELDNSFSESAFDLFIEKETDWGSHCQSTLVAKNQIKDPYSSLCRFGIATSAHCVDDPFVALQIGTDLKIPKTQLITCIPMKYKRNKLLKGKSHQNTPSDVATLIFDLPCEKIPQKPVVFAPISPEGTTVIDKTGSFFLQKRKTPAPGNSGGGKVIQAELTEDEGASFSFFAPSPQGVAIVGGDSGGPIFNSKGQYVCPMARSTYEYLRRDNKLSLPEAEKGDNNPVDPFQVSCDKLALRKIKEHLNHFQISLDPADLAPEKLSFEKHRDCR